MSKEITTYFNLESVHGEKVVLFYLCNTYGSLVDLQKLETHRARDLAVELSAYELGMTV